MKRLEIGLRMAERMGATHGILTGKADPMQEDVGYLADLLKLTSRYMPIVDMHTNGIVLQKNLEIMNRLIDNGLSMITFSIASFDKDENKSLMGVEQNPVALIGNAVHEGLLVRCSLVVNKKGVRDINGIMEYVHRAGNLGAHMVVIREVWVPEVSSVYDAKVLDWNVKNKIPIGPLEEEFVKIAKDRNNAYGLQQRDPLPWGVPVFVIGRTLKDVNHGVNVTFARCDQANSGPVMKSIVHLPDGHGYRNWDHRGDILY